MTTSRRDFIMHGAAVGTTLLAAGPTLPGFLTRSARACTGASHDDRVLVVIQLTGGNDGLNTVIPYADDAYHRARPTLRVPAERVHVLDDRLGLHPEMTGLKGLYDDGLLAVVNNVGYPNPDRSHFRSMDIWHTASTVEPESRPGWLGRVADRLGAAGSAPPALHLDEGTLPLALKSERLAVPSIRDIEDFRLRDDSGELESAIAARRANADENLLFVQRVAVSACRNARRIERVRDTAGAATRYPGFRLAGRLAQIADLIGAAYGPRIYYTSIGGFDTHSRQTLAHGPLLRELSESVTAFTRDLERRGLADRVLVMTFSEFGRRVRENGSQGTDHGAGAPMLLCGPACRAGMTGGAPDLGDSANGDVRHEIDFRQVYATVLGRWLGVDPEPVLGARYETLGVLRG